MKMYPFAVLLLSAIFFGGCSLSKSNLAPPTPLTEYPSQIEVQQRGSISVGSGDGDMYLRFQPAIVKGDPLMIYAADYKGKVTAVSVGEKLKRLWQKRPDEATLTAGAGAGEGIVLVGTQKAEVIALSQDTGDELWRATLSSEILSAPQVADNTVVVLSDDSRVFGLNAKNGELVWHQQNPSPLLQLRGSAPLLINNHTVYVGFANGFVSAINTQTGNLLWQQAVSFPRGRSEIDRIVDVNGQMAIDQGILYAVNYQGRAIAFDTRNPRILWERELSSYTGVAVNSDSVFISDADGRIWALSKQSGDTHWQQNDLSFRNLTAPAVYKNMIVVGDMDGYLHFIDARNGQLLGRTQLGSNPIHATPIVVGDDLFVLNSSGTLTRLSVNATP